jgi:small subunit ribosomal protein S13
MSYLLHKELVPTKLLSVELQKVFGINNYRAKKLCGICGVNKMSRVNKVSTERLARIHKYVTRNYKYGSELKIIVRNALRKKVQVRSRQGIRYALFLPMRGQRTKTNAKTAKKLHKTRVV